MDKRNRKNVRGIPPGIDPEDSLGADATASEVEKGDYTKVIRLKYDDYEPSKDYKS